MKYLIETKRTDSKLDMPPQRCEILFWFGETGKSSFDIVFQANQTIVTNTSSHRSYSHGSRMCHTKVFRFLRSYKNHKLVLTLQSNVGRFMLLSIPGICERVCTSSNFEVLKRLSTWIMTKTIITSLFMRITQRARECLQHSKVIPGEDVRRQTNKPSVWISWQRRPSAKTL